MGEVEDVGSEVLQVDVERALERASACLSMSVFPFLFCLLSVRVVFYVYAVVPTLSVSGCLPQTLKNCRCPPYKRRQVYPPF